VREIGSPTVGESSSISKGQANTRSEILVRCRWAKSPEEAVSSKLVNDQESRLQPQAIFSWPSNALYRLGAADGGGCSDRDKLKLQK
jgi:hypothetical protein